MQGNTRFAAICQGCDVPCQGCMIEDNTSMPICTPLFAHARSEFGTTTIEGVLVDPTYWRSSNRSTNLLSCFNPGACLGGLTDDPDYCRVGYKGPCEFLTINSWIQIRDTCFRLLFVWVGCRLARETNSSDQYSTALLYDTTAGATISLSCQTGTGWCSD